MKHIFFPILYLALAITACKKADDTPVNPIPVADVQQVADMNLRFGWEAFQKEAAANQGKNVLISPWSIQTALSMATNGAKDNTLAELLKAMHCDGCATEDLNTQQAKLTTLLEQQSGAARLTTANGYFYDNTRITVHGPFKSGLETHYKAGFSEQNFNDETAALAAINGWVKQKTNGKIDKILDNIKAEEVAFLINALHFKADWSQAFPAALVDSRPFTKPNGSAVNVDFVNNDSNFTMMEGADIRGVDLPFKDSTYSLTLIQAGAQNIDPNWFIALDADKYKALLAKAQVGRALVAFPRMKLAYEQDLIPTLRQLGVKDAFSDAAADFTGMGTAAGRILISQVKHKAVLEVDEKGAEGAAVTSVGFGVTSLPPVFSFDKPFVLALRHVATNTLVFVGYVAEPVQ